MDELSREDLEFIATTRYRNLDGDMIRKMIAFNEKVSKEAGVLWGHDGSPWEMNLRDVSRWCEAIIDATKTSG